jgi:hypothetical protein
MEIDNFSLFLMILFNTLFCLFLPKIVTFNWNNLFSARLDSASYLPQPSSLLNQEK